MNVRPISVDELDDLLELYTHLNPADAPLPERSLLLSIWQELMSNSRYKYFGGYVCDRLISTCTLSVIPNLTQGGRPYGIIENVVTHAEFRDRGYGKAVLAAALSLFCAGIVSNIEEGYRASQKVIQSGDMKRKYEDYRVYANKIFSSSSTV